MTSLTLSLPDELIEAIAQRAAEVVAERIVQTRAQDGSPWLTVAEAAEYLRCKPQRVYDLLSARTLPKYKDGSRVLLRRDDLDAYLEGRTARIPTVFPRGAGSRMDRRAGARAGNARNPCQTRPGVL